MKHTLRKPKKQQRRVSKVMLVILVGYVLNLCTLSPQVHAATLRHSSSGQSAVPEHCKQSSNTASPSAPIPTDHGTTPEPFCCEVRSGDNKALTSFFTYADFFPQLLQFLIPWDTPGFVTGVPSFHEVHARHSSHPPPLYLVYAILLI